MCGFNHRGSTITGRRTASSLTICHEALPRPITIGGVKVNDSKVTSAHILAKNGVIHVVDTVLIPQ
ncbi:MAG TPA: fasciclin domain-containing protein [Polyangiaceae bacterium]|nr:fasciclin domain-containing protein [Polyangiaceae bacterium]